MQDQFSTESSSVGSSIFQDRLTSSTKSAGTDEENCSLGGRGVRDIGIGTSCTPTQAKGIGIIENERMKVLRY
jgi:hypothetical protein